MPNLYCRRDFIKATAIPAVGSIGFPALALGKVGVTAPLKRSFGRTGFEVTTLGLGGQASLQWTPQGVDPVSIIVKAVELGVNYLDTSNVYGPSQANFGKAMRILNLVPGTPSYDEKRRRSLFLASKTMVRFAKGSRQGVPDRSEGPAGSRAVDDIRRSLSLLFGDGKGGYPAGAYLDLFQIHNLNTLAEVDAIFTGLENPDPKASEIGALAALVDFRDGTNLTGLNPKGEKLIRHIGITGHFSSPVMMECLQRDNAGVIEAMLIAINGNDRQYLSHQYNAIPIAEAKQVGMIAMKVFADGAMYTKEPHWTRGPEEVVRVVGTPELPSRPLVEYTLATPGICTAIIGIGQIDSDGRNCQLEQNLSAAQVRQNSFSETDRRDIEKIAQRARQGRTNWFQLEQAPASGPRDIAARVERQEREGIRVSLTWQTAYAADEPLVCYEIRRGGQSVGKVEHKPQLSKVPFRFEDAKPGSGRLEYQVIAVDRAGRKFPSEPVSVGG